MLLYTNPILYIQPDWDSALSEPGGKAWISCKYKGEPGFYGTIQRVNNNEDISSLEISEDFVIENFSIDFVQIKHKNSDVSTYFLRPARCLSNLHKKSITSLSVTRNGLGVSSGLDDSLLLWTTTKEDFKQKLTGHVGEVYKCRFFPSGQVVLSAGSDMRLKIWWTKTGECPVTLVGHTMAVTDVDFVERGRNVLSCSKDGYLKLWNCGDASCIYNIIKLSAPINCCKVSVSSSFFKLGHPAHELSEKEFGTEDKVVLIGCEDGTVHCVALKSHKKLFSNNIGSSVNCLCFITCDNYIVGCQDGSIHMYNAKYPTDIERSWKESNSAVLCVLQYNNFGFFSCRADGCVEFHFINGNNSLIKLSLTGVDCDPVYDIATDGEDVYTCCRDGKIRRYNVSHLINELSN